MNDFYLFLDIDGVLNNRQWLIKCKNCNLEKDGYSRYIDPKCMNALNYLIKNLQKKYNLHIVISSILKIQGLNEVEIFLKSQNLNITNPLMQTPNKYDKNRTSEIMSFMAQNNIGSHFLVIDDEDLSENLPLTKFILTTGFDNLGLTMEQVQNWISLNLKEITF